MTISHDARDATRSSVPLPSAQAPARRPWTAPRLRAMPVGRTENSLVPDPTYTDGIIYQS
jgi:hypothetical protein